MKPTTDMDYVELFAQKLKANANLFRQQKMLIESQLHSSWELFGKMFGTGEGFKTKARSYLKGLGVLE